MFSKHAHFSDTIPPPPPPDMAAKPKRRSSRIVLIAAVIVAIIVVTVVVLAFVSVPAGAGRVSMKNASMSWERNQLSGKYYVKGVTVVLTNNGKEQIFDLEIEVTGNWPVEYERERSLYVSVGAGLNPGETRTISRSGWDLLLSIAGTSQTGTYTATFRVGKLTAWSNEISGYQLADVYGECTITTHVP